MEEHFGGFHVMATVNNAIVRRGVHMSLQINVFKIWGRYPEEGLLGHMVTLLLMF